MSAEQKHTPEPWRVAKDTRTIVTNRIQIAHAWMFGGGQGVANAARIVACVNACAGMDDPQAVIDQAARAALMLGEALSERDKAVAESAAAMDRMVKVRDQRDELLAALEEAKAGLLWYRAEFPDAESECDFEAMERIDAAIAKCQP